MDDLENDALAQIEQKLDTFYSSLLRKGCPKKETSLYEETRDTYAQSLFDLMMTLLDSWNPAQSEMDAYDDLSWNP